MSLCSWFVLKTLTIFHDHVVLHSFLKVFVCLGTKVKVAVYKVSSLKPFTSVAVVDLFIQYAKPIRLHHSY